MEGGETVDILRLLPHRYPFLLIDRVVEIVPGQRIVAIKNVTANEPQFTGHFPADPIFPGVLLVECIAQACGILAGREGHKKFYLVGVDQFRFRRPVRPGDQLRVEARLMKHKGDIWKFSGSIEIDGKTVAEGEILAATARDNAQD